MKKRDDIDINLFGNIDKQFSDHLLLKGNERIVFSGRFGQGKTTFLREFFHEDNQDNRKTKYDVIHLYPVNYSVATNEDIFRYIKHDILYEIIQQGYEIDDYITSYLETLPGYLKKNGHKILAGIISMIPKIGKDVAEGFDRLNGIVEDYLKKHDEQVCKQNESNIVADYLDKLEQSEGNIYENDAITKLIETLIQRKNKEKRETILIIDDLDRIDPDHIFRILNIFSAHFDRRQGGNKFGFDKIIIVCDIKNIREIFRAKFGISADFNGYIDKFYSYRIFDFNNGELILKACKLLLKNAAWSYSEVPGHYNNALDHDLKYFDRSEFLYDILGMLVNDGHLPLRNVFKFAATPIHYRPHLKIDGVDYELVAKPILMQIAILVKLKGSCSNLKTAINECHTKSLDNKQINKYIADMMDIIARREINRATNMTPPSVRYFLDELDVKVEDRNGSISVLTPGNASIHFHYHHFIFCLNKLIDLFENAIPIQ